MWAVSRTVGNVSCLLLALWVGFESLGWRRVSLVVLGASASLLAPALVLALALGARLGLCPGSP